MFSLYKIINDKLVFVGRAKHQNTVDRFLKDWKVSNCTSTTIIVFTVPTPDNADGFVSYNSRVNMASIRLAA